MAYIAYAAAWIATSVAVSTAIYFTHSASPLWAMLIPTVISISSKRSDGEEERSDSDE